MSDLSPRSHPVLCDPARQALFCDALASNGNVRLACEAAAISPQTAYRARRSNPDFAQVWDAAMLLAREAVAQVLADRALNGVEEVIFYRGEEIGHRRRYDSRLLLAHLARLDRLAEQAETAALAQDFDAAVAALERGEDLPGAEEEEEDYAYEEEDIPDLEAMLQWLEANGICDPDEQRAYLHYTEVCPGEPLEALPHYFAEIFPGRVPSGPLLGSNNPPPTGEGDRRAAGMEGLPESPSVGKPLHHRSDGPPLPLGEEVAAQLPPDPHNFRNWQYRP